MEPISEYRTRLNTHQAELQLSQKKEQQTSWARLFVFVLGLLASWLPYAFDSRWAWALLLPLALFIFLVVRHSALVQQLRRLKLAIEFCEDGLERASQTVPSQAMDGLQHLPEDHLYAKDLDLFGKGSLFARICRARSGAGQKTLARWLLHPADQQEVLDRQAAVSELAPDLAWRETMAVTAGTLEEGANPEALNQWLARTSQPVSLGIRLLCVVLTTISLIALSLWGFGVTGGLPLLAAIILQSLVGQWVVSPRVAHLQAMDSAVRELGRLNSMLAHLEASSFEADWLKRRTSHLQSEGKKPSEHLKALQKTYDRWEMKQNPIFALIAALFFWTTHHVAKIERWRIQHRQDVSVWITALSECEALASLAGAAFDAPEDCVPAPVEHDQPFVNAKALAHPFLPTDLAVRNDVQLGRDPEASQHTPAPALWILSGSNMAGKSTLLRALGVNLVLAQAGARVRASEFRWSHPLQIGATIRIVDSLEDGVSLFYAEIKKLKQIVDQARQAETQLVFLFDEILHGTNSAERRRGAEAVLRHLIESPEVKGKTMGIVTTHDLALVSLAESMQPKGVALNLHLSESTQNQESATEQARLTFDYKLKQGPVTRGSALDLMRQIGLPV